MVSPLAIEALTKNQRQLDIDGVEVGVSRQALDELLAAYNVLLSANEFLRNERDRIEKNWLEMARQRNVISDSLSECIGEVEWLSRKLDMPTHPDQTSPMTVERERWEE